MSVAEKHGVQILINDRVDIAMAINAYGVHLGQTDMPVDAARRLLTSETVIGISTHNLAQVKIASQMAVDYVAFGPVFTTRTKADPEPLVGLHLIAEAKQIVGNIPLVAIGGITADNCLAVLEAGADSVALALAVVANPAKIAENMQRLMIISRS